MIFLFSQLQLHAPVGVNIGALSEYLLRIDNGGLALISLRFTFLLIAS